MYCYTSYTLTFFRKLVPSALLKDYVGEEHRRLHTLKAIEILRDDNILN